MSELIPRATFFGNPDRAMVRISPDGSTLSWLAPRDGVLNLWLAPTDNLDAARAITADTGRGIAQYAWARTGDRLLYLQDADGDENNHVYSVDPATDEVTDLTPIDGVAAQLMSLSDARPDHVVVGLNDRVAQLHDPYLIDVRTGERKKLGENPGFAGFLIDDDHAPRFGIAMTPTGDLQVLAATDSGWEPFTTIPSDDTLTTHLVGFDASGRTLYMLDSRERDTAALTATHLDTGRVRVLAHDPQADIEGWMQHPTTRVVEAASSVYERKRLHVLDPAIQADLDTLGQRVQGDVDVISRSVDDQLWVVAGMRDDGPIGYHLYRRDTGEVRFLFTNRSALDDLELRPMQPVVLRASDGLDMVSYLTRPPTESPVPLVLLVHGGPWARDSWGYNPLHQWLASRGYAVLSVNFRSSTGFGKAHINAGNKMWGTRMHDDLLDAVRWAIDEGITEPGRVAIMGGSYGGYAALAGLTFSPTFFACAIDIVGPSNLITLLETIPAYWAPMRALFDTRVGNIDSERELLTERSPLTHIDRIERPLLIGQGANDPRVKEAESTQIVDAMRQRSIPVTYALFPDEGHGFARPENRLAFYAVAEQFLAEHLGGSAEAIGSAFEGSSIELSS